MKVIAKFIRKGWRYYVFMYENGKIRPAETTPGMGDMGVKEIDGRVNSTIINCKNFYKCHNVSPVQ
jgi:hypothetical protein